MNDTECLIFISFYILTATFNDRKKETVCKDQSSGRNMIMIEASQSPGNWAGHIGVKVENEVSEGDYEEIDNIFNTPFTMEYNMSYSTVTQTAM